MPAPVATTTPPENKRFLRSHRGLAFFFIAAGYFALITIALFGVDLLWRPRAVVSAAEMDVERQFYGWREFAFTEWRATGRPPLWNPYAFGGAAALGNFQYALLYPPNWLHLVLPTTWAINLIAAMHVWLAGLLTAAWCRARGSSILASLIGGTIFALSGPYLLHLYAGHLTYVCVVAWTPLVFLAVDRIAETSAWPLPSILVGAVAVAMQVSGGYPQPAFYTALAVIVYAVLRVVGGRSEASRSLSVGVLRALGCITAMYLLGAALAAAQLLPGLAAARESVRAASGDYAFESSYSLPPENLLTLIVPYPFGDDFSSPYAGRWVMWEMSLYVGGVAVMLAVCALAARGRRGARRMPLAVVLALAILLALGQHTPLFRAMYEIVPGIGRFRAPARFAFVVALIMSALAAAGFDAVRQAPFPRRTVATLAAVIAAALAAFSFVPSSLRQLGTAAMIFAQVAVILLLIGRWRRVAYLLPLLVLFELWRPAARTIEWFRPRPPPPQLAHITPEDRVVTTAERMFGVTTRFHVEDAWGYDPATAARWAELVGPLLGADPRRGDFAPTRDLSETSHSPIWAMLRVRHALPPTTTQPLGIEPLPRVMLLSDVQVVDGPAASLAAVQATDFDPRKRVVLESTPDPAPSIGDGNAGEARVAGRTSDSLTIDADLTRSAILLVTDAYSAGWRTEPPYRVMPADHALRAIALPAGRHHIVMQYRPAGIRAGMIISSVAIMITIALGITPVVRRRRAKPIDPPATAA
jgi:hypothetical protein